MPVSGFPFFKKMKYLLTALLAMATLPMAAQINFKIEVLPDNETYQVSFVSDVDYTFPNNLVASGQITIRVPHGLGPNYFEVADLTMATAANWADNSRVDAPVEAPSWDYISFGLTSPGTDAYPFQAGIELPVFTFKNGADFCADSVEVVNNFTDPFLPPNSVGANINNTLVVLGGGLANSYSGTVGTGIVPCLPEVLCDDEEITDIYLCNGEDYMGLTFTQDTTFEIHYTGYYGCDSAFITNIFVWQDSFPPVDTSICQGKSFNGVTIMQDEEITVTLVSYGGCDSTVTYNVSVILPTSGSQDVIVLPGQSVNGIPVFSDTSIVETLTAANGCDSVHTTNVTVFQVPTSVQDVELCQGEMYLGEAWPQDTTLIDTLVASSGFDSLAVTNIFVNPVYQIINNVSLCSGDSYLGTVYTQDESFTENLLTVNACDSSIVTNIDVVEVQIFTVDTTICYGELFLGELYDSDTVFQAIVPSVNGCDSVIYETALQVLPAANADISGELEICGGETSTLTAFGGATFEWSTGATTNSILIDQTQTYSVTVTNSFGCTDSETVEVEVSSLEVLATAHSPQCNEDLTGSITFDQVNGGFPPYAYSIDGGNFYTTHTDFPNLSPGTFDVNVRDDSGCFWQETLTIVDPTDLFLDLGDDETIRLGESVQIDPITNLFEPATIEWSPASDSSLCADCLEQEVTPLETTTYRLVLTDSSGCSVQGSVKITVNAQHQVYLPTAFSPNGDGPNDLLFVQGGDNVAQVRQFVVFERWGGQVFSAKDFQPNDPSLGWDGNWQGKTMPTGTYVWMAEVEFIDGEVELFEGGVLLLR